MNGKDGFSPKLAELLKEVLDSRVRLPDEKKRLADLGIPKSKMTMRAVIAAKIYEMAAEGNAKAIELILSICGEKDQFSNDAVEIIIGNGDETPKEDTDERQKTET